MRPTDQELHVLRVAAGEGGSVIDPEVEYDCFLKGWLGSDDKITPAGQAILRAYGGRPGPKLRSRTIRGVFE